MGYKYLLSGSPLSFQSTQQTFLDGFQGFLNDQFYNAPDIYTIQEEVVLGSNSFSDVVVRVNRAINSSTGEKLGDDFKLILFPDLNHATGLGYKYYFDNNYWIVVFSEIFKNIAASCMVRRCNNVLRWIDEDGNYYTEPCAIDYVISRPRDESGSANPVTPQGMIDVYAQGNIRTRTIKENQRFLFGPPNNRRAFKIFGDGLRTFLNQNTMDDTSANMLKFNMGGNYVNPETDDLVNGIADGKKFVFSLSLSPSSISGSVGSTYQLIPNLTLNGIVSTKPLSYYSSSSSIATVSSSGIVTLVSSGSANIVCHMTDNITASAITLATCSSSIDLYDIRISPNQQYIFEDDTVTFSSYLYLNGVQQADAFTYAIANSDVPTANYEFNVIDGNNFSIKNKLKYLNDPLVIDITSGSYASQLSLEMRGSW